MSHRVAGQEQPSTTSCTGWVAPLAKTVGFAAAAVEAWRQHLLEAGPVEVSVCIANWNCRDYLRRCLESLLDTHQGVCLEVIVVDNASSDGAADMVEREFPEVILIRNSTNLGFAQANNQASRRAQGRYLFFLNNDTLIPQDALGQLLDFALANPNAGMVGPRLCDASGRTQVSYRLEPTLGTLLHRTALLRWTGLLRGAYRRYRRKDFRTETTRPVEVLMGAAMLIPRDAFFRVGGWDEDFISGGEDIDLSTRIRRVSQAIYHPEVEIVHSGRIRTRTHIGFASSHMNIGLRFARTAATESPRSFTLVVTLIWPVQTLKGQYCLRRLLGQTTRQPARGPSRGWTHF